jgi:GTPase SAR1 family protein
MKARDNPFSSRKILKIRYLPQSTTWVELLARLKHLNYRAGIVGPEGSGKTTLLEDLAGELGEQFPIRWFSLRLDSSVPLVDGIDEKDLVFVDGADLLDRFSWRSLLGLPCAGLIVTLHQPMHLPTLIQCSANPELLQNILRQLIGDSAEKMRETSRSLFLKHNGNLRDVLREFYDIWATQRPAARS